VKGLRMHAGAQPKADAPLANMLAMIEEARK